eukprot:CAMPEP_0203808884 /NCGR_PEP_ID=MMETSP0115-20131106/1880_1 /ASSEMBLY_ACC=CAM_ASM_000227 /TAXON_ID=33651 /ORGANISM="Bicosoecid sp, Strain ms1" /LENGTH=48 /DNA_ID= /DNA_START= /DNA_END= /DNA_ORIENTATION=
MSIDPRGAGTHAYGPAERRSQPEAPATATRRGQNTHRSFTHDAQRDPP